MFLLRGSSICGILYVFPMLFLLSYTNATIFLMYMFILMLAKISLINSSHAIPIDILYLSACLNCLTTQRATIDESTQSNQPRPVLNIERGVNISQAACEILTPVQNV